MDTENLVLKRRLNKQHLELEKSAASWLFVVSTLMHVSNYWNGLKWAHKNVQKTE